MPKFKVLTLIRVGVTEYVNEGDVVDGEMFGASVDQLLAVNAIKPVVEVPPAPAPDQKKKG